MLLPALATAKNVAQKKQLARTQFETAERMREALSGSPAEERSRRDYQRVTDAYRRVYYTAPTSNKADEAAVAVAELLAEAGRAFNDTKSLQAAIGQYEFLRREYPGSRHRFDALFTIGQIYKDDLKDTAQAKVTFQEFLKRYPSHNFADDARQAIAELERPPEKRKETGAPKAEPAKTEQKSALTLVTGVRHWSTPDYTRVAIDLGSEVKYEAGRIPNPDRIFFDLHDTKLVSVLVGKSFEVQDGFLRQIRVAQYQKGMTRVVLDVDDVSDYSAFLLPNPYRLIIDIHGKPAAKSLVRRETPQQKEAAIAAAKAPSAVLGQSESKTVSAVPKQSVQDSTEKKGALQSKQQPEFVGQKPPATIQPKSEVKAAKRTEEVPVSATVARLSQPELKATTKPTSAPTFESVAPREKLPTRKRSKIAAATHEAQPAANGERSLIRALGLKIGRIVVDAGHGGHDTGTIGPYGLQEKDLVLDVALRLGKLLRTRMGAEVVYTRDDDTFIPLETRTAIANQNQADLFVSIHANSSNDTSTRGVETYYLNFTSSPDALEVAARENAVSEKSIFELQDLVKKIALKEKIEESREFAADVQKSLYSGMAAKSSAIRNRGIKKAPFIVLIGANMPSILAEISFLSNPTDERRLQTPEYRQRIAEYLYKGIGKYVSGLSGVKVAAKVIPDPSQ